MAGRACLLLESTSGICWNKRRKNCNAFERDTSVQCDFEIETILKAPLARLRVYMAYTPCAGAQGFGEPWSCKTAFNAVLLALSRERPAGQPDAFTFFACDKNFSGVLTRHTGTYCIIHSMYCIVSGKERTEWISNGKRALLDVCVLAVLRRGPSYGYKDHREVSSCIEVSESTLYPILEASGGKRIRHHGHTGARRPIRRYFYITDAGRGTH